MPQLYNDSLDDPLVFDACLTFVGGQVSNVRANLLDQAQYSEGSNVDIDRFGGIVTRHGTKREYNALLDIYWENCATNWEAYAPYWSHDGSGRLNGLGYFDTPSLEQLVAVNDQKIYKHTNTGIWAEVSGYTPAADAQVEMAQLTDKLFLTDGTNNVRSYDGTSFTDEGTGTGNPPVCKYLVAHTNRIFAAGISSVPDALYASDLLDGQTFDNVNFQIRIGGDSGDPITGLCPWLGQNLVVFKERSIFNVATDPQASTASGWVVENIDTRIGCVSHRSIAQVGQDIFFLAPDGIRTVRSILEGAATAISEPISVGIQDVINTINWSATKDKACATFWRNHYILAVATGSSTTLNKCIVYNTITRSFVGVWDWNASAFCMSAFGGEMRLNFGTENGKVLVYQDYIQVDDEVTDTYLDDGAEISSHLKTRAMTFGQQFNEILPNHTELEMKPATSSQVDIRAILDDDADSVVNQTPINTFGGSVKLGADPDSRLPFTLGRTVPIKNSYNLITKGPCRELQFKVQTSAGKMHLRGVRSSAYVNTLQQET